ncbi:MAG: prevent-host-death family protein [Polycyclovorans sp.]|jgi:prevent-host-death family protein|nr:prevent-host-death family protein [Polycyclovorans sp.]|tara:strand:- start:381 stop:629 length:249 start_codon:yes stop_codon:yes gene_type:complete
MITISLAEAKNRFSELVTRVQNGEQVSVTRRGKPVVNMVAADNASEPQQQAQVADVFQQLAAISANRNLSGDLKVIAREGLD